jgi:hypothetical protein
MRLLREIVAWIAALGTQRPLSRFVCEGCDMRDACSLPAGRRQMCQEARALRPR